MYAKRATPFHWESPRASLGKNLIEWEGGAKKCISLNFEWSGKEI